MQLALMSAMAHLSGFAALLGLELKHSLGLYVISRG